MPVHLTNMSRSPIVVTLYHDKFCIGGGPCHCVRKRMQTWVLGPDGTYKPKFEERRIPASLRLEPKGRPHSKLGGVHEAILKVPQIQGALKTRPPQLRAIVVQDDPAPKAAPKPEPAPVPEAAPTATESPVDSGDAPEPRSDAPKKKRRSTKARS